MPHPLPISLVVFTTASGHFGNKDVYQTLIKNLERQCGGDLASVFANRVAHIKARPSRQKEWREVLPDMEAFFAAHRIQTVVTFAEWERGPDMGRAQLDDHRKVARLQSIQDQPYMLLQEDDAPIDTCGSELIELFASDCKRLERDYRVLACRYAWNEATDLQPFEEDPTMMLSPHFHFQPTVMRSRDFLISANLIRNNWEQFSRMHCEEVVSLTMRALCQDDYRFLVHRQDLAYAYHIGGPDYPEIKAARGL